jgi:hypothetical protein
MFLLRMGHQARQAHQEDVPTSITDTHNVFLCPQVSLRRGRTSHLARAREVDSQIAGPILQRYLRQAPVTAPFFDARADDPAHVFVEEADRHPVFAVT